MQVGQCLKELIGGSKDLPYLKDPRYDFPELPTKSRKQTKDKIKEEKSVNKNDLLYRKCFEFPFVKMFSSQLSNQIK